jgi:predicted PurR-regulated permease PerM
MAEMSRAHLFTAFFFLVFAFLLYQVYLVFSGFLEPAIWAAILALVFHPVYRALLRKIQRPSLAALAVTLLIYLMVVLPAFGLGGVAVQQSQRLYSLVQEKVESGEAREWVGRARWSRVVRLAERALPGQLGTRIDFVDLGLQTSKAGTQYIVGQLGGIARNILSFAVSFFLMMVILFFFFRDGERLYLSLRDLIPMEAEHKDAIFSRFYHTLSAVVQGMTVTAVAQGLLAGLCFWILDVPFALLLSLLSALASFIPLGGAALVWVPVVIYLVTQELWWRAFVMFLLGVFVISLADNIVKPLVIGSRIRVPTLFLFFGILGGLQAYGVLGVFLGPALLAAIVAVFRIYREEYNIPDHTLLTPTSTPIIGGEAPPSSGSIRVEKI